LEAHEEVGAELAFAHLGHAQLQRAHPRGQAARLEPVTVAPPLLGALVAPRLEIVTHLGLQDLLHDPLHQGSQRPIAGEQPGHLILVYGKLIVGHRFSPVRLLIS